MAGDIGKIKIGLGINLKGFRRDLNRSAFMLKRQAAKFQALGSSMTSSITLPLGLIGGATVKLAVDLETSFGQIRNLVGVTGDDLLYLKCFIIGQIIIRHI